MQPQQIKTLITVLLPFLIFSTVFAQDSLDTKSIKPLRIGVKVGIPNIITANAEYVTPLLHNRVAFAIDYMSLSKTIDETKINYSNFEIGTNVYLNTKGKGLYGGLSYFSFDGEGSYPDTEFDDGSVSDGTGLIKFNTVNLKLGVKLGRVFYFRMEVGYALGSIPEHILVQSNSSSQTIYEDIGDVPGITSSGMPVFNFGIGFAFL